MIEAVILLLGALACFTFDQNSRRKDKQATEARRNEINLEIWQTKLENGLGHEPYPE